MCFVCVGAHVHAISLYMYVSVHISVHVYRQLLDDKEYEDIVEDIRLECEECGGPVLSVKIPRPVRGFEHESDPAFQKQQKEVKEESGESQPSPAPAVPPTVKKEENSDEKPVKNEQQDGGASDQAKTEEGEPGTREEEKPATVGFAYVEFEDCEWSAKARKVSAQNNLPKLRFFPLLETTETVALFFRQREASP